MRVWLIPGTALALTVALTGCFTSTADFRSDAETFIETNAGLQTALFADSDVAIESATCVEPESQDEGTSFGCTALDTDGDTWEFEVVITGSNEYEVNLARAPLDS